jgi:hypothetical protein
VRCAALVLTACFGAIDSPEDYAQLRAQAECRQIERCERGYFESEYSSFDDCVEDHATALEDEHEAQEVSDCVYVPEEARKCVTLIRSFDCEDWAELDAFKACNLVYECPGGFPYPYGYGVRR